MKRAIAIALLAAAAVVGAGYVTGYLPLPIGHSAPPMQAKAARPAHELVPAVTVTAASSMSFTSTVLVTGSLVARNEILVAPEVEGLRIVELVAEEGDSVRKEQVLAKLEQATLDAQLAQNEAALARASAAIAQARSQIEQSEARLAEARANFERAQPLKRSGALSEAVYDQREAAARTAAAQLTSARDGLRLAEAERAQIEAQRRELSWKRSRTEIKAPAEGLVSRRTARVGAMASAAGEPMFRMAAAGEIELEAEVPETDMGRLQPGQKARITVPGAGGVEGRVRLVSPEVDRITRLGRVRVSLGADARLRIGTFGRGVIEVGRSTGLAVPSSSVLYVGEGPIILVANADAIETRRVRVGLSSGEVTEIIGGLAEGDLVVAKAGTFLRDGDRIKPVRSGAETVSEVN